MKLSKDRYSYLIHKDMEWLTANTERTIERDHIMAVLEDSISLQYPNENMEEKEEKTSRRFNVGDNVRRKSTCSAGVVTELFNDDMYGVLFNGRVLDAASGDDLEPCTAEEVAAASNVARLLEGAEFGDEFETRDGRRAIYQRFVRVEDEEEKGTFSVSHILFTEDDELMCSTDGTSQQMGDGGDIVGRWTRKKDTVDKYHLDDIATNWNVNLVIHPHMVDEEAYYYKDVVEAFKYGYEKRAEEEAK